MLFDVLGPYLMMYAVYLSCYHAIGIIISYNETMIMFLVLVYTCFFDTLYISIGL